MNYHEGLGKLTVELHPVVRGSFLDCYREMQKSRVLSVLRPFEIARTPEKQEEHRAAGNSKVGAWRSVHQYGCAVDFVPYLGGKFTWDWDSWDELHRFVERFGLNAPIEWDKPHITAIGWRTDLRHWLLTNSFK